MVEDLAIIQFKNKLSLNETSVFRGCIINELKDQADVLFHNHLDDDGFRQLYPLIQYKAINGCASILFIGDGVEKIGQILSLSNREVHIGKRVEALEIGSLTPLQFDIAFSELPIKYSIKNWMPFNEQNVQKFQSEPLLVPRIKMLEEILVGNILSMAKGLNIYFEDRITCGICSLSDPYMTECKHVQMMCFDAEFICNLKLPDYIGIGKHTSFGYGTIEHKQHTSNL